jgi:hypothetical protein
MGKAQLQTLTHGHQDCHKPNVFSNVISQFVQVMKYVETIRYLEDLLILTGHSVDDQL